MRQEASLVQEIKIAESALKTTREASGEAKRRFEFKSRDLEVRVRVRVRVS